MTINTGFEQPRVPSGASSRERRAQAQMAGGHSVLKELGLGTNDPDSALHMVKETAGAAVMIERIQTSVNSGAFQSRKARGTLDNRAAVADDDDLLTISGFAYVGDNNQYEETCRIEYEVDGSVSDASKGAPGRIVFRTSSGSGLTKRMRITKDGKVGIGLDDPSTKLTVEGAITMKEQSAADTDAAAYGQMWVKTATPNELYFTTDAGNDIQITSGTSLAAGGMTSFQLEDGDGTEVAISNAKEVKFVEGQGIDINWTDTDNGTDGDPYDLTFTVNLEGTELASTGESGGSKFLREDGDGTCSWQTVSGGGSGDITSVVAGSGMTGGATSGDATLNVIGGDGITANADEVEATVDGSTIELSASDGSGAIRIKDDGVTYAKIQNVTATDRILGRDSAGAGVIEEITPANLRTMINVADGATATTDTNTTYAISCVDGDNSDEEKIRLTAGGSGSGTDDVVLEAGTGLSIARSSDKITFTNTVSDTNTTYSAGTLLDLSTTTFNVDLTEAAEAVMADGDYILFLDGGATGSHAKEAVADVATLFAGDGLTASSSVMAVNVDDSTIETSSDAIRVKDNGVTLAKMAGLARGKIIHGDASGDPAALALGSANTVLQSDGTDAAWGTGATAMIADNAVSLAKMAGLARGSIIYGDASGDPAALSVGSNTYVLTSDGTDVAWAAASGGGSGDVEAGSTFTTAGVIMACSGPDKTIDEPNALLTTNGQGMTVSAALATPFQVDSGARDGNSTFKFTTGSGSGTNNQASIQVIAQTAANANLYLGDTDAAARGGLTYKNNGDSLQLKAAGAAVLELDSAKVVEFKIAEVADSGSDYAYDSKVLKIKVNGTDYYLPLYAEAGGGGMGGP